MKWKYIKKIIEILTYIWCHPSNRSNRFRVILQSIAWQIKKRLNKDPIDVEVFDNLIMRLYPNNTCASSVIYCSGIPDYHEMLFTKRYLRKGDSMLDIGANIGIYSILASSIVGPTGQILSFEPGIEAYRRLTENLRINSIQNVTVFPCAIGDRDGEVDFLEHNDTINRIVTNADTGQSAIKVPLMRLDDIVKIKCNLGKIDIEGAEPLAFNGAGKLLKESNPPVWIVEINDSLQAFGYSKETFSDWLFVKGYDLGAYNADRNELSFILPKPWKISQNVFVVARNRREEVAHRSGARLIII